MNKVLSTALVFLFVSVLQSCGAISPEAKAILDKSEEAMGGRAKLEAIKSVHMKSTITLKGMRIVFNSESYMKGNKSYSRTTQYPGIDEHVGFDGKVAWSSSLSWGLRVLEGKERFQVINSTLPATLSPEKYYDNITYGGKVKFDNKDCHKIVYKKKGYKDSFSYIDVETNLPAGGESTEHGPQGEQKGTFFIRKFSKSASGVSYPSEMEFVSGPSKAIVTIKSYKENVPVDDKIFQKPAK